MQNKTKYFYFFTILFFFKPICFQYITNLLIVDKIFIICKIIMALIILTKSFFAKFPNIKIHKYINSLILFELSILCITLYYRGAVMRALIDMVTIVSFSLFIINELPKNKEKFLHTFCNVIFVYIFLNFISEILYPSGIHADLYTNSLNPLYFMTVDNGTTVLILLGIMLIYLSDYYSKLKYKKIKLLICIMCALFSGSSTAFICSFVLIISLFLNSKYNFKFLDNNYFYLIIFATLFVSVLLGNNSIINKLIFAITGKVGFTGRNFLWENAIGMIKSSPLIGYGRLNQDYLHVWGGYFSSHNFFLELLLQGGVVALFCFFICLSKYIKKAKNINEKFVRRTCWISFLLFLIAMMMESSVHSIYLFSVIGISVALGENYERRRIN